MWVCFCVCLSTYTHMNALGLVMPKDIKIHFFQPFMVSIALIFALNPILFPACILLSCLCVFSVQIFAANFYFPSSFVSFVFATSVFLWMNSLSHTSHFSSSDPKIYFLFLLCCCESQLPACLIHFLCLCFQDAFVVCSSSQRSSSSCNSSRMEPVIPVYHCF